MRGHIGKRGNSYYIVYDVGRDENGKRKQQLKSGFKTKKEAEKALADIIAKIDKGEYAVPQDITIGQFLDKWLEMRKAKLAPKTFKSYNETVQLHLKPYFGDIKLPKLVPITIEEYYNYQKSKGTLSDTTLNYHHRIFKEVLKYAVKWGYISRNPCEAVEPPKIKREKVTPWPVEVIPHVEEIFKNTPIYMHVMLALYSGMRIGEICGLRWEDIDFNNKLCMVRRTAQKVNKELIFKEPKSETSQRIVTLTDNIINILKDVKEQQEANKSKHKDYYDKTYDGYISVWEDGRFMEPEYVSKKFHKILADHKELPMITFHTLRHTHASLLLAAKVPMKVVSERLGHSQIGITMDLYSHVSIEMQRNATKELEHLLQSNKV